MLIKFLTWLTLIRSALAIRTFGQCSVLMYSPILHFLNLHTSCQALINFILPFMITTTIKKHIVSGYWSVIWRCMVFLTFVHNFKCQLAIDILEISNNFFLDLQAKFNFEMLIFGFPLRHFFSRIKMQM